MSIGFTGPISSLAATPLAQTKGTDADKVARETSDAARAKEGDRQAENAAGIGETSEDAETADRDADGRRQWERGQSSEQATATDTPTADPVPRSKDPSGSSGTILDVSG